MLAAETVCAEKTTPKKKLSFALGNGTIELTDSSESADEEDDDEATPMVLLTLWFTLLTSRIIQAVEEEPSCQPAVKQEGGAPVEDKTAPPKVLLLQTAEQPVRAIALLQKRAKQAGIASELPLVLTQSAMSKCGGAFLMQVWQL